jgi:hypothetical protein
MNNKEADRLELATGTCAIEFAAEGLFVFYEPQYAKRIAIAGLRGVTLVNKAQALELANGLREIVEMYMEETA